MYIEILFYSILLMLYVTKQLDLDGIVDAFARKHPRRMEFVNIISDEIETV